MKISDENVKSRQYEPTKAYIIGLNKICGSDKVVEWAQEHHVVC